jgi:hypothetical protein
MIGFIEHFFIITVNYSATANLHSSLGNAPFSFLYSQLLLSSKVKVKVKVTLRLTVSQSVSLSVEPHLGPMARYQILFDSYGLVFVGRPL